jgi:hypothetical protein
MTLSIALYIKFHYVECHILFIVALNVGTLSSRRLIMMTKIKSEKAPILNFFVLQQEKINVSFETQFLIVCILF